jgi:hypothetical protein
MLWIIDTRNYKITHITKNYNETLLSQNMINRVKKTLAHIILTLSEYMAVLNPATPLVLELRLHGAFFFGKSYMHN